MTTPVAAFCAAPAFVEGFDDNDNGWAVGEDARRRLVIFGGRYEIGHKRDVGAWSTWRRVPIEGDHRISAGLTKLGGANDHGYGILFGAAGERDKQSFVVSGDGHFRYGVFTAGRFENVTGWRKSAAIRRGDGAKNVLAAERRGRELSLFVNGERVATVDARPAAGDRVGFEVNHRIAIAVDELEVRPLAAAREAAVAAPASGRVVAVFDIVDASGKTPKDLRMELTEYLIARLVQKGEVSVVPRAQLRSELKRSKAKSYDACFDQQCQIELGKAAAANAILTTRVMRVGESCVVTSTLFDLETETTGRAATAKRNACTAPELLTALEEIAAGL